VNEILIANTMNIPSAPKAVNSNNLPKKPDRGGTPANENKNKLSSAKTKPFCQYKDEK
jgi:hypothetical protein